MLRPPPSPGDAARGFIEWGVEWGAYGDTHWGGADGVWALYLWYAEHVARCHPVPDNLFARSLGEIVASRQVSDYSTGRRRRLTVYTLPETLDEIDAEPAIDAGMRRAA